MPAVIGEFELIQRFFAQSPPGVAPGSGVGLGIGDDAALLHVPAGEDLVAAVDSIVEGRHFPPGSPPHSIGHRALAVNLSDMAAMGATPRWCLLALTLPAADPEWLEPFAAGLLALAARHGVALVGGDTTGGALNVGVQILGTAPQGRALRRSGASPGDLIAVTGTLGDAAAGLVLLQRPPVTRPALPEELELVRRFEYPTPRVDFGIAARGLASAAIDLSDGLAGDLPKLAAASGVGAHVALERLPLSDALQTLFPGDPGRRLALGGGDDYELLVSVPPQRYQELADAALHAGVALTVVGELRPGRDVNWSMHGRAVEVDARGYDHFR